ncbi:kinase-like domain-containing protein [Lineolata rhizophorae]|uniref:Kinase-like domain-containing protein n=1 Tax=Lineolata rhizophorae TaxID=578093 RepID=A0A6A6P1Z6_9PEZI|nr:kinase-like domain-containing protein [Lineolata rhizophorae]
MYWKSYKIKANAMTRELYVLLQDSKGSCRLLSSFAEDVQDPECLEKDAIHEAVEEAWIRGAYTPQGIKPHSILRIKSSATGLLGVLVNNLDDYNTFYSYLKPLDQYFNKSVQGEGGYLTPPSEVDHIEYRTVTYVRAFDSYRSTSRTAKIGSSQDIVVYKGISFLDFLAFGEGRFREYVNAIYREHHLISSVIPPHPNIMAAPKAYVTLDSTFPDGSTVPRICGCIFPYYNNGSLAAVLNRSVEERTRISLKRKAKWCYQLVSAMAHVHFVASAWHQDLKPPNILIDDNDDLLLIDWEQVGQGGFFIAPESDGTFDVSTVEEDGGKQKLVYTRYEGPRRVNNTLSHPEWNVLPTWKEEHPKAVELAEVHSTGATLYLLLEQVRLVHVEGVSDYSAEEVRWSEWSDDIPQSWKESITKCRMLDPNERIGMMELLEFWKTEYGKLS